MFLGVLLLVIIMTGCATQQTVLPVTESYDSRSGILVQKQYTTTSSSLAEIEKEKSRQVCFENSQAVIPEGASPESIVMLQALSAMSKALSPDQCKGSTNESDVQIAKNNNLHGTMRSIAGNVMNLGLGWVLGSAIEKGFDSAGNTIKGSDRSNLGEGDFNESVPTTTTTTTITNPVPEDVNIPEV